ncbi:MAG: chloride channel protein [Fimbriimonadaceae bacterium]|nr:chloride channel protein [Alphaproteobacteria bacterium]
MTSIFQFLRERIEPNFREFLSGRDAFLWVIAIAIGLIAAAGAIVFRLGIGAVQYFWLDTRSEIYIDAARNLPWWMLIMAPMTGGLLVGLILHYWMPSRRAEAVADVIEARALRGSRITLRQGLTSALVSVISLGSGASAGREGPVVHLGASLASVIGYRFSFNNAARRIILSCGVAGAVSASFNAPIAGVLFAHEVILGHYARTAFVPIVLSSVGATIVSRLWFGDFPAFFVPSYHIQSLWEFPAFALLGLTCALVVICFQFSISISDWMARNITVPLWTRPVIGGAVIGAIALYFPEILGVGYEATDLALKQQYTLVMLLSLLVVKSVATAITLASRFGGGIFSPSIYIGAMTGSAFGLIAAQVFPDLVSSNGLYAILGMGAVAASVLGAPISTTMIVFELTGGLTMSIALLLTISISYAMTQLVFGGSFFNWQLGTRGLVLHGGPHKQIVKMIRVEDFMRSPDDGDEIVHFDMESEQPWLAMNDTLETALRTFDAGGHTKIAVVDEWDENRIVGWAYHIDALAAFNSDLIAASREEHS